MTGVGAAPTILVIEDGAEYCDAFRRLAGGRARIVRAGSARAARAIFAGETVAGVFVDVVFDRALPEDLSGDLASLTSRCGGDAERAAKSRVEDQGFFILEDLKELLAGSVPVMLGYDFTHEPERLEELRETFPRLLGAPDPPTASKLLHTLLAEVG